MLCLITPYLIIFGPAILIYVCLWYTFYTCRCVRALEHFPCEQPGSFMHLWWKLFSSCIPQKHAKVAAFSQFRLPSGLLQLAAHVVFAYLLFLFH